MSALWAPAGHSTGHSTGRADGARAEPTKAARPSLKAVAASPARMARVPFIGVLIAVFGLGMAGLLMLNTSLQNQGFEAGGLKRQATELTYAQAELQSQLMKASAPQELARRASAMGMRPNPDPAFLRLPDGKVLGEPTRVRGDEAELLVVKTPAELAKEKAAAAAKKAAKAAARQTAEADRAAAARAKALAAQRVAAERAQTAADAAAKKPAAATKPAAAKPAVATSSTQRPAAAGKSRPASQQQGARR